MVICLVSTQQHSEPFRAGKLLIVFIQCLPRNLLRGPHLSSRRLREEGKLWGLEAVHREERGESRGRMTQIYKQLHNIQFFTSCTGKNLKTLMLCSVGKAVGKLACSLTIVDSIDRYRRLRRQIGSMLQI